MKQWTRHLPAVLRPGRERGIAIIMTLGILSLLMVLAMSFAFDAQTGRLVARNNANIAFTRLLLDASIQRAGALVDSVGSSYPGSRFYNPGGRDPALGNDWDGRAYLGSYTTDTLNSNHDSPFYVTLDLGIHGANITFAPGDPIHNNLGWNYLYKTNDSNGNGGTATSDSVIGRYAYFVIDESGKVDPGAIGSPSGGDTGLATSEMDLANALTSRLCGTDTATIVNDFAAANPRWDSWTNILRTGITNLDNTTLIGPDGAATTLFPFSYDPETFFNPATSANQPRFNLARTDWATVSVTDVLSGIPWLDNAAVTTRSKQIAANLIDYCDADDKATVDNTANPTYCGNEKTVYLNKFRFKITHSAANTVEVELTPEWVNLYDIALPIVNGEQQIVFSIDADEIAAVNNITTDWDGFLTDVGVAAPRSYWKLGTNTVNVNLGAAHTQLTNFVITVNSARLCKEGDSTHILDFSRCGASAPVFLDYDSAGDETRYTSVEANDPRQNLDPSDWTWRPWDTGYTCALERINASCSPPAAGSDYDDESTSVMDSGADAAIDTIMSTAYIRNAPMKSIWELGAIHRGSQWETINLHDYNGTGATNWETTYRNGDANILEQVCLTSETAVGGRINPNTSLYTSWNTLLGHMRTGGTYGNPAGGSTPIAPADIAQIAVDNAAGRVLADRGALAVIPELVTGSHDAAQEEVVAKVANYCSVRQNYFTVIAVAQALRDVGPASTVPDCFEYTSGSYAVPLGEEKAMAVLYRDAFTGETRVEHLEYLNP